MNQMTKKQKRYLNELANYCYEREMSMALEALFNNFMQWKSNEISPWELNQKIHEHHNGTARELYKFYELSRDPVICVARGITKEVIGIEDVREDCKVFVQRLFDFYNQEVDADG